MRLDKIFKLFVPKDRIFYTLFEQDAENLVKISGLLNQLMVTEIPSRKDELILSIKELEKVGDDITHQIYENLNRSFITPFDREDIQELAGQMDDVADYINGTAQKIKLYKPKRITPEFAKLAAIIQEATEQILIAIQELKNIKNPEKIKQACIKIDSIENQADDLYHFAISELFAKETNSTELIKNKEILESLERATDQAEDVSDVIKTILIKFA